MTSSDTRVVRAYVPATVANLGPGFDVLGLALRAPGDTVTARFARDGSSGVEISAITGDRGQLPQRADENTAGIAAIATLRRAGVERAIELELDKGLPIGSGLGSSAASAAAAAFAVNVLIGSPLRKVELIEPCIEAEGSVAGRHADNVAPALLGGLILVRSVDPLDVVRIPLPEDLVVVTATPDFELPTRRAREVLPREVSLRRVVRTSANLAALISACYSRDLGLLGRCIVDDVVAPARAALIPGGEQVIRAAYDGGALGSSVSGAGPTIFALCHSSPVAEQVAREMAAAFSDAGLEAATAISPADCPGARTA